MFPVLSENILVTEQGVRQCCYKPCFGPQNSSSDQQPPYFKGHFTLGRTHTLRHRPRTSPALTSFFTWDTCPQNLHQKAVWFLATILKIANQLRPFQPSHKCPNFRRRDVPIIDVSRRRDVSIIDVKIEALYTSTTSWGFLFLSESS